MYMQPKYSSNIGEGFTPDPNYPSDTPYGQGYYWKHNQQTGGLEKSPTQESKINRGYPAGTPSGAEQWPTNQNQQEQPQEQQDPFAGVPTERQPDIMYNIGRKDIENEAIAAMNETMLFPPAQQMILMKNAQAVHDMKMAELNLNRNKVKMAFRDINMDNRFDAEQREQMRVKYLSANPLYEPAQMKMTGLTKKKSVFTPAQEQRGMGELSKYIGVKSREDIISGVGGAIEMFGPNFEQTVPEVANYINQNWPETPIETAEPTRPSYLQRFKNWWSGTAEEPRLDIEGINPPPTIQTIETIPQKPTGYPDAVFNQQYKMWTIFKNGKLVGLKEQ